MAREGRGESIVRLEDFEGEVEEHWQGARGRRVLDKNGDEVGAVEELYVWERPATVHLIGVSGDERSFLIPVHTVTNVEEDAVTLEVGRDTIMASPEFDFDDVPDAETRRAVYDYYGYSDPLDLGGG